MARPSPTAPPTLTVDITVPGKPHTRGATIAGLMAYLAATGWEERPDRIIPHEPGPHPFYRGEECVYFADDWVNAPMHLARAIEEIADVEGRHPVDVLDAIASMSQEQDAAP